MSAAADRARREELAELMRVASARVVARAARGERVDPITLARSRRIVATQRPLGRPLGTGEPA